MTRARYVTTGGQRYAVRIDCPGCGEHHVLPIIAGHGAQWSFNGDLDRPTLMPSILARSGHYASHHVPGEDCGCTYNDAHPDDPDPFTCYVCHSFVRDGRIQFLGDCTHALAGQTVDLPELSDA